MGSKAVAQFGLLIILLKVAFKKKKVTKMGLTSSLTLPFTA